MYTYASFFLEVNNLTLFCSLLSDNLRRNSTWHHYLYLLLSVEFPSNHLIKLQTKESFRTSLTCIQKHIVNVTSLIPMKLGVNKKSRPLYRFRIEDSKILFPVKDYNFYGPFHATLILLIHLYSLLLCEK